MKTLFVASELAPWAKVGGLGDVIGSLPKALAKLVVNVSVVIPCYEKINLKRLGAKLVLKDFSVRIGRTRERINLYKTRLPGNRVSVYLIDNKRYLSRGEVYFERTAFAGSFKEIQRFVFFSQAVYELLASGKLNADIVHANDWHTGALVSLLKNRHSDAVKNGGRISAGSFAGAEDDSPRVVFTIHNLANQGDWNAGQIEKWFGQSNFRTRGKNFNFMAEGIKNADLVTTVSPSYAKEILAQKYGVGLEKLLQKRARQRKLIGILNGVDYDAWPLQKRNKKRFQKELGLAINPPSPIFGLVARLTYQKGINLIAPIVPQFVKKYGAQFVFLGQGEKQNEKALKALAGKYPKNVYMKIGFDADLAKKIYAQSDFFLMPSLFEPSGLGQMISMRYGTIPIVRATGGLKDTVIHKKTGFVFEKPASQGLAGAIEEALRTFVDRKKFQEIIANCRREDFSWKKSAKKYLKLYDKLGREKNGEAVKRNN